MATRQWHGGHSSPVLCVGAAGGPEGLLASGSEGGQVTVWSQDGTILGSVALAGGDDCTGVAFSPAAAAGPGRLYAAHGETVSVLDTRDLRAVVTAIPGAGEEEINCVAVSEDGAFVAVADDSGAVRVLDAAAGMRVCRTLRRHTNICSSVAFRPGRAGSLLSAGLDTQVILWSQQKTRPLWTLSLQEAAAAAAAAEADGGGREQSADDRLFNPPLAHCVSVAGCGDVVACAAEDGNVHLVRVGAGAKLERHGLFKAHRQGASQAHFLGFLSHPYWLATGGNDGQVLLWDLSRSPVVAPDAAAAKPGAPAAHHHRKAKARTKGRATPKGRSHKAPPHGAAAAAKEVEEEPPKEEEEEEEEEEPGATGNADRASSADEGPKWGPRLQFSHGDKVNWVCPVQLGGEPSLVVADQSSSLTVYSLSGL